MTSSECNAAAIGVMIAILCFVAPQYARAATVVSQTVVTQFLPENPPPGTPNNGLLLDNDNLTAPVTDIDREVIASIRSTDFGVEANASIDRFGNVGMDGRLNTRGQLDARISIIGTGYDELRPSVPARATQTFVIDGGLLTLLAGTGSTGTLTFVASALVNNRLVDSANFQITLEQVTLGSYNLTQTGNIAPPITQQDGLVTIDPFLGQLDLGIVAPSDTVQLQYLLEGQLILTGPTEGGRFTFSDPGALTFEPLDFAPVPLPAGAWLLGSAVLAFGSLARRRPAAT